MSRLLSASAGALALAVLSLTACGNPPKLNADAYYREATEAFQHKNYDVAIKQYKGLLDNFPFSDHAEEAELRIAHAHYKSKQYPEAIAAFNDFQRMHPLSPHLPEVYYLLGKSYMDQMTTVDRDQGASENAHGWFRVVLERYPTSPYAAKARKRLIQCREALAGHELYIATYYLKRSNLKAGENRVKGILENYPDTTAATRAVEQLAEAYAKAGEESHETLARAALAERGGDPPPAAGADPPAAPANGPATDTLLADLTTRYGAGQGLSAAATAPSLLDPVTPKTGTKGGPSGPSGGGGGAIGGPDY